MLPFGPHRFLVLTRFTVLEATLKTFYPALSGKPWLDSLGNAVIGKIPSRGIRTDLEPGRLRAKHNRLDFFNGLSPESQNLIVPSSLEMVISPGNISFFLEKCARALPHDFKPLLIFFGGVFS